MKSLSLVEVEWLDSQVLGRWRSTEEYKALEPAVIWSVGYLLAKTRTKVLLVQSYDPDNDSLTDAIAIPRAAVRKIRKWSQDEVQS